MHTCFAISVVRYTVKELEKALLVSTVLQSLKSNVLNSFHPCTTPCPPFYLLVAAVSWAQQPWSEEWTWCWGGSQQEESLWTLASYPDPGRPSAWSAYATMETFGMTCHHTVEKDDIITTGFRCCSKDCTNIRIISNYGNREWLWQHNDIKALANFLILWATNVNVNDEQRIPSYFCRRDWLQTCTPSSQM